LTNEVVSWVDHNLGPDYAWLGNIRELEQCVRSIMIRGSYAPARRPSLLKKSQVAEFLAKVEKGELDRDQLLSGYSSLVYATNGSYRATGRQLGDDWRTVKEIVDAELVRKFSEEETNPF
jgi:transcriptional regulator with GAF, ATPase, and Fis domain